MGVVYNTRHSENSVCTKTEWESIDYIERGLCSLPTNVYKKDMLRV